jgi:hypothetical protein
MGTNANAEAIEIHAGNRTCKLTAPNRKASAMGGWQYLHAQPFGILAERSGRTRGGSSLHIEDVHKSLASPDRVAVLPYANCAGGGLPTFSVP